MYIDHYMWIGWLREFEPCNHVVQVIWVTLAVWLMVHTISHFMNLLSTGKNPFLGITGNIKLWLFLLKRINSQVFVQKYLLSNQFLYLNDKNSTMSRLMNGIDYKHCRVNSMQSSLWKVISFRFLSRYNSNYFRRTHSLQNYPQHRALWLHCCSLEVIINSLSIWRSFTDYAFISARDPVAESIRNSQLPQQVLVSRMVCARWYLWRILTFPRFFFINSFFIRIQHHIENHVALH